jgi:hypothetical protein
MEASMARSRSVSLVALAAALGLATPCLANVGITSVTAGDPLGQPPAEPERILRVGIDIQANERVTTKENDRAHLVFLDGTALTVGPSSTIVIDKYVYDPNRKAGELSLSTAKGVFRLVGGAISKTNDIKVTTPSATIGIRGGIATFEVANGGATKATFLYGEKMTVTGQGQTQIATRNGSQIEAANGRPPTVPAVVPPNGLAPMAAFERVATRAVAQQTTATAPQTQTGPADNTPTTTARTSPTPATTTTTTGTTSTPIVTAVQIDAALNNSDLGKTNSGLSRQRLNQEARFHHHNRGHALAALGPPGSGDSKSGGGPSVLSGGSARLAAPSINNVLRQVTVATRQVSNNTAKVNSVQNTNSNSNSNSKKR